MFLKFYPPTFHILKPVGSSPLRSFRKLLCLLVLTAVTSGATADLSLSWTDNSDNETGFEIERSTDGTNFSSLDTVGANVTSYADTTVVGGTTYWYRVRAYNGGGNSGYTNIANSTVLIANSVPTISSISDQAFDEGSATGAIAFTIADAETSAGSLNVTVSSSSTSLVPNGNIVLGGSGSNRTITVTPSVGQTGSTTITLTVSDGEFSASESFTVTVNQVVSSVFSYDLPSGGTTNLESSDVGTMGISGSTVYVQSSGNVTLTAGGTDIWGTSDGFRFVWRQMSGDFAVVTRVLSQTQPNTYAKAGIMIRDSLAANSIHATASINSGSEIAYLLTRRATGDSTPISGSVNVGWPTWLKLQRVGSQLTSFYSTDGLSWIEYGSDTVNLNTTVYAGLAVTAHTTSDTITAVFSGLDFVAPTLPNSPPTISSIPDQLTVESTALNSIAFSVSDAESSSGSLTLSATSTNTALIPIGNVIFGGSGANRSISVTPMTGITGSTAITVTVSDGEASASEQFLVTVNAAPNTPPTISAISDQSVVESTTVGPLSFNLADSEAGTVSLSLSASSSNPSLIPIGNVTFGGSNANRTVTITPVVGQTGSSVMSITVSDGELSTTEQFNVAVTATPNSVPSISSINDLSVVHSTSTGLITFTVTDGETPSTDLVVSATSSNTALVPASNIVLSGTGDNRTVAITPVDGVLGASTITLSVSDGETTSSTDFSLTATAAPNTLPTISSVADQTTFESSTVGPLAFVVADAETAAESLILSGSSSNTSIVPDQNILFGGSGTNRTVKIVPVANITGSVVITLNVNDGEDSVNKQFIVSFEDAPNSVPTISSIADQSTLSSIAIGPVEFTISDNELNLELLALSANSSNTSLIPVENITFGGTGANRTFTITPVDGLSGSSDITITVSDGEYQSSVTFNVNVGSSSAPAIVGLSDQDYFQGDPISSVPFSISDTDTSVDDLIITHTSSNASLLPVSGIQLSGNGSNRTLVLNTSGNATGSAMVTVTVSDGANLTSRSFTLTVNDPRAAPAISLQPFDTEALEGTESVLSVLATGSPAPTYQWLFNGVAIPGATEALFGYAETQLSHEGEYAVVVTNSEGAVTSSSAALTVEPTVKILSGPSSQTMNTNGNVVLTVEASGPDLEYQWYEGESGDTSNPIPEATSATFTSPLLSADAQYWVRVTTASGGRLLSSGESVDSATAIITFRTGYVYSFGPLSGSRGGDFAIAIRNDGTGIIMAKVDTLAGQDSVDIVSQEFDIDQFGSFAVVSETAGVISGTAINGLVQGSIESLGVEFAGVVSAENGETSEYAGYYEANYLYESAGELNLLVGPDGEGFAILIDGNGTKAGIAIVDPEGVVTTAFDEEVLIEADVANATRVSAIVSDVNSGESFRLSGISDTTEEKRQLVNTSIRTTLREGGDRMIAGFVVSGEPGETKQVLIRGIGPRLSDFGVSGTLVDPKIELFRIFWDGSSELMAENDNWYEADNFMEVSQKSIEVGAFHLNLGGKDAALLVDLPVGIYSAHVRDTDGGAGAAMVEVYDVDTIEEEAPASNLANISIRGEAGVGADSIIAGFVVNGNTPKRVLVRAVGPELADFGVPGVLADPELTLYRLAWDGTTEIVGGNDDWRGSDIVSEVSQQVGAFPIQADSNSAAMVIWLEPGVYSAHASSVTGESGVAIVEVYDAPTE